MTFKEDRSYLILKKCKDYVWKKNQPAPSQSPRKDYGTNTAGIILHMPGQGFRKRKSSRTAGMDLPMANHTQTT